MLETLNVRKIKFLGVSILIGSILFLFRQGTEFNLYLYLVILALLTLTSVYFIVESLNSPVLFLYSTIIPIHLSTGAVLSLLGFPNLSILFRLLICLVFSVLYYVSLLVLNIFVVAGSRGKSIPLSRAANTWSQILVVISCIPFYAGVFKLPVHPLFQIITIVTSSFLLGLFYLKMQESETDVFRPVLPLSVSLWVLSMTASILFMPFEAAFRALFLASVMLFGMGFIEGYIKHTLTKKTLIEYLIITVSFLLLGLLFVP